MSRCSAEVCVLKVRRAMAIEHTDQVDMRLAITWSTFGWRRGAVRVGGMMAYLRAATRDKDVGSHAAEGTNDAEGSLYWENVATPAEAGWSGYNTKEAERLARHLLCVFFLFVFFSTYSHFLPFPSPPPPPPRNLHPTPPPPPPPPPPPLSCLCFWVCCFIFFVWSS